ncbi:hypothetical protein FHX06_007167 [Rhizobium sp. BK512]|nr:hypothetical protein [Rhizobium sp. BK512]
MPKSPSVVRRYGADAANVCALVDAPKRPPDDI